MLQPLPIVAEHFTTSTESKDDNIIIYYSTSVGTSRCRSVSVDVGRYRSIPIDIDRYRRTSTDTDRCRIINDDVIIFKLCSRREMFGGDGKWLEYPHKAEWGEGLKNYDLILGWSQRICGVLLTSSLKSIRFSVQISAKDRFFVKRP